MTHVELTDQQARAFILLSKAGAWEIKNGSIELHFDGEGNPIKSKTTQFCSLAPLSTSDSSSATLTVVI